MAAGIPEVLDELVTRLAGAGLTASATVGGVVVPGVWVHVLTYSPLSINGRTAQLTVAVDLIAEDVDEVTALAELDHMLGLALTVVAPSGPVETDNAIDFPSGALPSFRIPLTVNYTKEQP